MSKKVLSVKKGKRFYPAVIAVQLNKTEARRKPEGRIEENQRNTPRRPVNTFSMDHHEVMNRPPTLCGFQPR